MSAPSIEPPKILQTHPALGDAGKIHVYRPSAEECGPWPFVFGIHGGGWRQGDQTSYTFLPPKLLPLGIAVVLASYRQAPEFPFPAAYDDLMQALEWLAQHGGEHGLDTTRCLLFGGSAGGHLAMLLAARARAGAHPTLRGVVAYCGIMDLTAQFAWDEQNGQTMTQDFLQVTPQENPELYRLASPMEHAHANMPPVWMTHGDADAVVPIEQSRQMAARLTEAGCRPIFHENPDAGHVLAQGDPLLLVFEAEVLKFIKNTLAPTKP